MVTGERKRRGEEHGIPERSGEEGFAVGVAVWLQHFLCFPRAPSTQQDRAALAAWHQHDPICFAGAQEDLFSHTLLILPTPPVQGTCGQGAAAA